ncbi:MAG: glycoside hydrolase family 9 protein [Bacteroidia bacterium]|nr:glycoside hydrolase family 9 protein [Bacteroidia bacterium]
MKKLTTFCAVLALLTATTAGAQTFKLGDGGYFSAGGVDVMAFNDYYPEGHQGGICVIMNGNRIATNGDIRFEPTPGQWQPVPRQVKRVIDDDAITTYLAYPDSSRHMTGFNPMLYPDMQLTYSVSLQPYGQGLLVTVDLDQEIPERFLGKVGFNLEFFPGILFGKPWIMDGQDGIFPQQANAPLELRDSYTEHIGDFLRPGAPAVTDLDRLNRGDYSPYISDKIVAMPYAQGKKFTVLPDDPLKRFTITSLTGDMKLYDGRLNHNNGWFVLRGEVAKGATIGAIKWLIEPNVVESWRYPAVVQTSQVGYHVNQPKVAVIETDKRDSPLAEAQLFKVEADGEHMVKNIPVEVWEGDFFLRYKYLQADFSDVTEPGLYRIRYAQSESSLFRINDDVYERGVWQPVLEYFLPVQMCHMRVTDKYHVYHDACHMDDARYAEDGNHIDGYDQRPGIKANYKAGDIVPGLNIGGWHDAGDFDLRIESQIGEVYILTNAYEHFKPEIDVTAIDFNRHNVEIHQPDGRNDLLQQIENGCITVVNGYLALGRLYRGIICNSLRQYVLLGDASAMTDGVIGNEDDRWVFTENNPGREISTAAGLAASARVLRNFNDTLAAHCERIAIELFDNVNLPDSRKLQTAVELYFTTGDLKYFDIVMANWDNIVRGISRNAWYTYRIAKELEGQKKYRKQLEAYNTALAKYAESIKAQTTTSPYGVPYRPDIWGAGWTIQSFGYEYSFLAEAYPDLFPAVTVYNALNFVLGCHPGTNQASFASGVGTVSATVGYGLNRADWSYIPGGVISGTAVIRPDFPELLTFPYLWQQTEYVLGGGSSHYMYLVLAARKLLGK